MKQYLNFQYFEFFIAHKQLHEYMKTKIEKIQNVNSNIFQEWKNIRGEMKSRYSL